MRFPLLVLAGFVVDDVLAFLDLRAGEVPAAGSSSSSESTGGGAGGSDCRARLDRPGGLLLLEVDGVRASSSDEFWKRRGRPLCCRLPASDKGFSLDRSLDDNIKRTIMRLSSIAPAGFFPFVVLVIGDSRETAATEVGGTAEGGRSNVCSWKTRRGRREDWGEGDTECGREKRSQWRRESVQVAKCASFYS